MCCTWVSNTAMPCVYTLMVVVKATVPATHFWRVALKAPIESLPVDVDCVPCLVGVGCSVCSKYARTGDEVSQRSPPTATLYEKSALTLTSRVADSGADASPWVTVSMVLAAAAPAIANVAAARSRSGAMLVEDSERISGRNYYTVASDIQK